MSLVDEQTLPVWTLTAAALSISLYGAGRDVIQHVYVSDSWKSVCSQLPHSWFLAHEKWQLRKMKTMKNICRQQLAHDSRVVRDQSRKMQENVAAVNENKEKGRSA